MAARKAATRKKAARKKKAAKPKSAIQRIEAELPKTLRDFGKQVRKDLNTLERDIERAIPAARKRTARVIRDVSHELGRIEERGEAAWKKSVRKATKDAHELTKDAQGLLRKLEKAVAPPRAKPKKKAARKKVAG
jgi:ElaB/YqjD/DUF883 family membrane-anchored ribosome-binding protein